MPTQFATPTIRLVIVSIASALFYWPLVWLAVASVLDRKRIFQSVAKDRVLFAVIVGFLLSLAIWTLSRLDPSIFGILNWPAGIFEVLGFITSLYRKPSVTIQIVGNTIAYSVVFYLVLYWRLNEALRQTLRVRTLESLR